MNSIGSLKTYSASFIAAATLAVFLCLSFGAGSVMADQYGPYGGPEEQKEILIDKMVGMPIDVKGGTSVQYVDNIAADDYLFSSNEAVYFRLLVRNTSDVRLEDVVISDFAPDYFGLIENPGDVEGDVLTLNAGDFEPNEEKVFIIRGRVDTSIPAGTTCVTNRARAESGDVADEDTSQFCIQSEGGIEIPPETIPEAGAAEGVLISSLAAAVGYLGMRIRRLG